MVGRMLRPVAVGLWGLVLATVASAFMPGISRCGMVPTPGLPALSAADTVEPNTVTSPFENPGVVQVRMKLRHVCTHRDGTVLSRDAGSERAKSPSHPSADRISCVSFVQRSGDEHLPLTLENVEMVLDEMRPYLMSDGYVG
jgi:hypothetical protein